MNLRIYWVMANALATSNALGCACATVTTGARDSQGARAWPKSKHACMTSRRTWRGHPGVKLTASARATDIALNTVGAAAIPAASLV